VACVLIFASEPLAAQGRDSTRAELDTLAPRPERQPPISSKRAFLYSLVVPGYAQSMLDRHRAGTLFMAFEAFTVVMIRQSAADMREARRNVADSVIVSFVDASGVPQISYQRTPFSSALLRSRRAHFEDWMAVLLANHLFAAADAYVAALLWDLPAEMSLRAEPHSVGFALRLRW
jgi:hypothetical protein